MVEENNPTKAVAGIIEASSMDNQLFSDGRIVGDSQGYEYSYTFIPRLRSPDGCELNYFKRLEECLDMFSYAVAWDGCGGTG